ncbi:MAG TPA: hypothetical protein VIU65_08030, partial [Pyrinomonadaceae bacterium]
MLQFEDTSGIFENFEVNATPFWPRVSRLIGGSIVLHLILVACVVFIPPVRDALSIAAMFSDVGFVDRAYNKTEIEAGDITEITTEKFHYPEGYFAMDQMGFPSPSPTPLVVVQHFNPAPAPPKQIDPTQLPTPTPSPSAIAVAGVSPTPTPTAEEDAARKAAEAELDKMAKESGVKRPKEINTRPFKDLLADAKKKKDSGELKLDGQIELTVEADLGPDGKLINAKVTGAKGDKSLESTALGFVAALSESGV